MGVLRLILLGTEQRRTAPGAVRQAPRKCPDLPVPAEALHLLVKSALKTRRHLPPVQFLDEKYLTRKFQNQFFEGGSAVILGRAVPFPGVKCA